MTVGPNALAVTDNLAGEVVVSGALTALEVAGGTPGTIEAGHIGTIEVYGGYGPFVAQIEEAGIQRTVELTTPGDPFPNPSETDLPTPSGSSYLNVQYLYESGSLTNPQLTARVTNGVGSSADQYDLSLNTYNDLAKFNLARLDSNGISGLRNVAIEGDLLPAVTSLAEGWFGPSLTQLVASSIGGVVLPLDALADVAVRDFAPQYRIQAKTIQAVAFGSFLGVNDLPQPAWDSTASDALLLLTSDTRVVQAVDTFRVPFTDVAAEQVAFYLSTDPNGGVLDSRPVLFTVEPDVGPSNAAQAPWSP